jgi:hypothetical protein
VAGPPTAMPVVRLQEMEAAPKAFRQELPKEHPCMLNTVRLEGTAERSLIQDLVSAMVVMAVSAIAQPVDQVTMDRSMCAALKKVAAAAADGARVAVAMGGQSAATMKLMVPRDITSLSCKVPWVETAVQRIQEPSERRAKRAVRSVSANPRARWA